MLVVVFYGGMLDNVIMNNLFLGKLWVLLMRFVGLVMDVVYFCVC